MSKIIPFSFENLSVRVIQRDDGGDPWFVAADVCEALSIANSRDAVTRLDDDERGVATTDTPGGPQDMAIVNESGLYSLILTSRKPEAKRFKKWVTAEVLPSIRKTGAYLPQTATLESLPETIRRQIGGMVKAIIHKEIGEAIRVELPALIHGAIAKQQVSVRIGKTAGQIWREYGLEPLKNAANWLSARLSELNCQIDGGGCAEAGGKKSKLFDPDKVSVAMKNGLLAYCKQYAKERLGQASLFPQK